MGLRDQLLIRNLFSQSGDILPPELQQQSNGGTAGGGAAESQSDSTPLLPPLSPPSHAPPPLPPALLHLFQNSGLITTIASNLSNDSGKFVQW